MSLTIKQFNGANVTPKDDAVLYHLFEPTSGVIEGAEVTFLGANQIQIADGRFFVCGRQIVVTQETVLATLGSNVPGRLLLQVDVSNTDNPVTFVSQAAATLPDLVQEDINGDGSVYQLPLATYTAGETQLTDFVAVDNTIPAAFTQTSAAGIFVRYDTAQGLTTAQKTQARSNIGAGTPVTVDTALSTTSAHPVQNKVITNNLATKVNKPSEVSGSGAVTVAVADNTEYTYTAVTSLTMTGNTSEAHGFVTFASSTPTISVTGFNASGGDDVAEAAASEIWEFSTDNGYILWKNWSA